MEYLAHTLLHVNSSQRSEGTANEFSIDFNTRDLDNVIKVCMVKATLPRMFTNINSSNNKLIITHAGAQNIATIPVGQYDIVSLLAALNTATAFIFFTWTYDIPTSRLIATYSGVTTADLTLSGSTIASYIGLTADITLGAPASLQAPPQLSGPDEVFIRTKLLSCCIENGNLTATGLLGSISFTDVPYGFTGRFDAHSPELGHIVTAPMCLRKLYVVLCDAYGNILNCPENCFLDMMLQITFIKDNF